MCYIHCNIKLIDYALQKCIHKVGESACNDIVRFTEQLKVFTTKKHSKNNKTPFKNIQ